MIEVLAYINSGKLKSMWCKGLGNNGSVSSGKLFNIIRKNPDHDVKFIDKNNGCVDITYKCLFNVLVLAEKNSTAGPDINLTNVIKNGGLIEYIKKLEGKNELEK